MRHLIDSREPITLADIDAARSDATQALKEFETVILVDPDGLRDLVERLAAIVEDTYGTFNDGQVTV